ncbi:olfactory receptor 6N1-like [Dendrobates tinctorius]|uniref:olfactory receptor 6N1-like n=1 Tax=Dendrobates tinctorius TaxID=92724 RepID=UPI003CC94866
MRSYKADQNIEIPLDNHSSVHEFHLQGFLISTYQQVFFFLAIFLIYIFILLGNALIAILVCISRQLQNPMYILLGNFSFTEICYTTVILPQTLEHILSANKTISHTKCLLQLYFCSSFGSTECLLLSTMAYDRYLAICHPLHYSTVMRNSVCTCLSLLCWLTGLLGSLLPLLMVSKLVFCGPSEINHFFCESLKLFELSCTDTSTSRLLLFFFASTIVLGSSAMIVLSYTAIIGTILKFSSTIAKQKAFSTCAAHLLVVSLFYGTLIFMYIAPPAIESNEIQKSLSLLYTVFTPLLNPIIYSLRNRDIHRILGLKMVRVKLSLPGKLFSRKQLANVPLKESGPCTISTREVKQEAILTGDLRFKETELSTFLIVKKRND